jgi:Uma2 family endonuclease
MTMDRQQERSMSEPAEPPPWTNEERLRLPDDGNRYEIVKGDLFVTPEQEPEHQHAALALYRLLWKHLEANPVGECFNAPFDVMLDERTVVQPDVLFVSKERLGIIIRRGLTAAPDLVVEVISDYTRRRDIGPKLRAYAKHGVREYWIVDPRDRRVDVYVRDQRRFVNRLSATSGEVASPLVLPGFSVPLAKLFG